jgi:alpha-glucosidase
MRFWLKRGVDGFRLDAAAVLAKDEQLRDDPPDPEADDDTPPPQRLRRDYSDARPEAVAWLAEMRAVAEEFPDRVLLGEVDTSPERIASYYGSRDRPALHLPLNYLLLDKPWTGHELASEIRGYLERVPSHGWPLWGIGGQDKRRIATKVGVDQARNAALLAFTLRGTPLFYAGDEIGMQQVCKPDHEPLDPFERLVPGYGLNRDPERAPLPWEPGEHAGFTTGTPWLPMAEDCQQHNVQAQRADSGSLLHLYRRLIALRREEPALTEGGIEGVRGDGDCLSFLRTAGKRRLHIAVNLGGQSQAVNLYTSGAVLLSTQRDRGGQPVSGAVELRPHEGVIVASD